MKEEIVSLEEELTRGEIIAYAPVGVLLDLLFNHYNDLTDEEIESIVSKVNSFVRANSKIILPVVHRADKECKKHKKVTDPVRIILRSLYQLVLETNNVECAFSICKWIGENYENDGEAKNQGFDFEILVDLIFKNLTYEKATNTDFVGVFSGVCLDLIESGFFGRRETVQTRGERCDAFREKRDATFLRIKKEKEIKQTSDAQDIIKRPIEQTDKIEDVIKWISRYIEAIRFLGGAKFDSFVDQHRKALGEKLLSALKRLQELKGLSQGAPKHKHLDINSTFAIFYKLFQKWEDPSIEEAICLTSFYVTIDIRGKCLADFLEFKSVNLELLGEYIPKMICVEGRPAEDNKLVHAIIKYMHLRIKNQQQETSTPKPIPDFSEIINALIVVADTDKASYIKDSLLAKFYLELLEYKENTTLLDRADVQRVEEALLERMDFPSLQTFITKYGLLRTRPNAFSIKTVIQQLSANKRWPIDYWVINLLTGNSEYMDGEDITIFTGEVCKRGTTEIILWLMSKQTGAMEQTGKKISIPTCIDAIFERLTGLMEGPDVPKQREKIIVTLEKLIRIPAVNSAEIVIQGMKLGLITGPAELPGLHGEFLGSQVIGTDTCNIGAKFTGELAKLIRAGKINLDDMNPDRGISYGLGEKPFSPNQPNHQP